MEFLSTEIICLIVSCEGLSLKDLFNLMLTCKRFLDAIRNYNILWRRWFATSFPWMPLHLLCKNTSWFLLYRQRFLASRKMRNELQQMSFKYYPFGEPPISRMESLVVGDDMGFIEDELLQRILQQDNDLAEHYYSLKVLRYLRTQRLERQLLEFLHVPSQQSLLRGSVLISNWAQLLQHGRLATLEEANLAIDDIVDKVRKHIFSLGPSVTSIRQFVTSLKQVFFVEMNFKVQFTQEDDGDLNEFYIDQVLEWKEGTLLNLAIIQHEVASRFGLHCELVSLSNGILHCWRREFPQKKSSQKSLCNDLPCIFLQPNDLSECSFPPDEELVILEPLDLFRMAIRKLDSTKASFRDSDNNELNQDTDELMFYRLASVFPTHSCDSSYVVKFAKNCLRGDIQLEEAIRLLQNTESGCKEEKLELKKMCFERRSHQLTLCKTRMECRRKDFPKLQYAVGLVMFNSAKNYECVIVDWDKKIMNDKSLVTINSKNNRKRLIQNYYLVLVNDKSEEHSVLQVEDDLELVYSPTPINHPDLGLHFNCFDGLRYVPNAAKKAHYPDDEDFFQYLRSESFFDCY